VKPETRLAQRSGATAEIMRTLRAYHAAMVDARTADLDDLLDPGFALVHITGYIQPKNEWFDVLRSGQFAYHRIEIDEKTISVSIEGDAAELTGRGIFNATINGARIPWRLQVSIRFARRGATWTITHARYTTF
jgi:Domain of unknown function (DUF4440)